MLTNWLNGRTLMVVALAKLSFAGAMASAEAWLAHSTAARTTPTSVVAARPRGLAVRFGAVMVEACGAYRWFMATLLTRPQARRVEETVRPPVTGRGESPANAEPASRPRTASAAHG